MSSFDQFKARFEAGGGDAELVVSLLVEGMCMLEIDSELGEQMMALVCSKRMLDASPDSPSGFLFRRTDDSLGRLRRNPNIARSYAGGTDHADYKDCQLSAPKVSFDKSYSAQRQGIDYPEAGKAKLFVTSGGADSPRPVTLAKNSAGRWKVIGFSSLTTGVRATATEHGDF